MMSKALFRLNLIFPINFALKIYLWFAYIQPSKINRLNDSPKDDLAVRWRRQHYRRRAINYFCFSEQVIFVALMVLHYYTATFHSDQSLPQVDLQQQKERDVLTFLLFVCPLANAIEAGVFTRLILVKGAKCLERTKWTDTIVRTRQVRKDGGGGEYDGDDAYQ